MLVHLVTHPRPNSTGLPRAAVRSLASSLRGAGAQVVTDVSAFASDDLGADVAACASQLTARWRGQRPDVVLAFGVVAASAAVAAEPQRPVVATFDEYPVDVPRERRLASDVTAVLPMCAREVEHWRRQRVPTLSAGVFPASVPVADRDAGARVGGWVVTFADDATLDALIAGLPGWECAGLVIGAHLPPDRWALLQRRARELGVADRVRHRPGLSGRRSAVRWDRAALLVAAPQEARHGWGALEAAAWGIPTVAPARDAYLDHVVHGATGLLVEPDPRTMAQAVGRLLGDGFRLRGLGMSARVRMGSVHEPSRSGTRLLDLLDQVASRDAAPAAFERPSLVGSGEQIADAVPGGDLEPVAAPGPVDRDQHTALVMAHLPLARQLADWYAGRGQAREDLDQVAYLGLVLAARRYDPTYGTPFPSFAVPTILGELRRHFRDHAWAVRVPRSLQEHVLAVRRAADDLAVQLGREATPADIAARVSLSEGDVVGALSAAGSARSVDSLDHPLGDDGSWLDRCGDVDPGHELAEVRPDVRALLQTLPEREQQALLLRYYGELTQSEIARRLGISQVQVSRILGRALAAIRGHVTEDAPLPQSWTSPRRAAPAGRGRQQRTARAS